jgi:DNA-binding transcriptional MocR family regulator
MSQDPVGRFAVPLTRREAVLRQLRREIVDGTLASGAVLKDAELAARLGVSITPVREALGQLAAEGLVDIAQPDPLRNSKPPSSPRPWRATDASTSTTAPACNACCSRTGLPGKALGRSPGKRRGLGPSLGQLPVSASSK